MCQVELCSYFLVVCICCYCYYHCCSHPLGYYEAEHKEYFGIIVLACDFDPSYFLNFRRNEKNSISLFALSIVLLGITKISHVSRHDLTCPLFALTWLWFIQNWKHFPESTWSFLGIFSNISQNLFQLSPESSWTIPRIFSNTPRNLFKHFSKC